MRFNKQKSYPYPVIRDFNDDYLDEKMILMKTEHEDSVLKLNSKIDQLVKHSAITMKEV